MSADTSSPAPRFVRIDRSQNLLRPIVIDRLIDEDHHARKIWQVVSQLDLSAFADNIRAFEGVAGRNAHSPALLISLWVYAFSRGLHSAREISRQIDYEPALQWLTGLRPVNHHTLSDFRVRHGQALRALFVQVLAILSKKKLITLERVAADGTKIRANVKRQSFRGKTTLVRHLELADKHLAELECQQDEEQTTRRQRAARERARREEKQRLEEALEEIEQLRATNQGKKKEPQVSSTDPAARFMHNSDGGLMPAYNTQVVADAKSGLIVDIEVVNDPQDSVQLDPAITRLQESFDRIPKQVLADAGYTNHASIVAMHQRGVDFYGQMTGRTKAPAPCTEKRHPDYHFTCFSYDEETNEMVCPRGRRLRHRTTRGLPGERINHTWAARAEECRACPARAECCPQASLAKIGRTVSIEIAHPAVETFDEKMATEAAQEIYGKRAPLVEFPNAWIKEKLKLRRFSCRGLTKVRCEALWAALTYNLQRAFRLAPEWAAASG